MLSELSAYPAAYDVGQRCCIRINEDIHIRDCRSNSRRTIQDDRGTCLLQLDSLGEFTTSQDLDSFVLVSKLGREKSEGDVSSHSTRATSNCNRWQRGFSHVAKVR